MVNSGVDGSRNVYPILTDTSGRQIVTSIDTYTKVQKYVALSGTGETTLWDPTSGTKFVITDIAVSASAAGTFTLRDGTAGTTLWIASLAANGGFVINFQTAIQSSTANNNLTGQASAATQYVLVTGYEV